MRKIAAVVFAIALAATCSAQGRGGARGGFGGHGGGRSFGGGERFGGGFLNRGRDYDYRPYYGNRYSFGFNFGYWPYYDWDDYGWYGYPYFYSYPCYYYYPYNYYSYGPYAYTPYVDPPDPPARQRHLIADGHWHHFGEK